MTMQFVMMEKRLSLVLVLSLLVIYATATSNNFTAVPVSRTVAPGSETEVVFFCQHAEADVLVWSLNGTSLVRLRLKNITACTNSLPDRSTLSRLKILPRLEYNGTIIVCIAAFYDESRSFEFTNPATLLLHDNAQLLSTGFVVTPDISDFVENETIVMATGQQVIFSCQHCEAVQIIWKINGTDVSPDTNNGSIILDYEIEPYCGPIHMLTVRAEPAYNNTNIICKVEIYGSELQESLPVQVYVQGILTSVSSLTRTSTDIYDSISYSWTPPFSLDISGIEPNIVYSIIIYDITCFSNRSRLVIEDCCVYHPNYSISSTFYNNLYEIRVIPRSNVKFASNGSSTQLQDKFIHLNLTNIHYIITVDYTTGYLDQILFILDQKNISQDQVPPSALEVELTSIDIPMSHSNISCSLSEVLHDRKEKSVTLNVTNCSGSKPEVMRLYSSEIYIPTKACENYPLSNAFPLSTHYVQNASIVAFRPSNSENDEILISGDFVNTSYGIPSGFLAIIYSTVDNSSSVVHGIATRQPDELNAEVFITVPRMQNYHYQTSLFALDSESGLPVNRSAAYLQTTFIRESKQLQSLTPKSNINLKATADGCITCNFFNSSTKITSCIVIISEKSQLTAKYGLRSIEVFSFNRSGSTAGGCIRKNLSSLNIAAFTYNGMITGRGTSAIVDPNPHTPENDDNITLIVVPTLIILVIIISVCPLVIVIGSCLKISNRPPNKRIQPTDDYSSVEENWVKKASSDVPMAMCGTDEYIMVSSKSVCRSTLRLQT